MWRRARHTLVVLGLATTCACVALEGLIGSDEETPTPPSDSGVCEDCANNANEASSTPSDDGGGLADVDVPSCLDAPDDPTLLDDAVAIATGALHVCAILKDKRVACWGNGGTIFAPIIEDGGPLASSATPRIIPGVTGAVKIASAYSTACVVDEAGKIVCWGTNAYGALGRGDLDAGNSLPAPVVLPNKSPVTNAVDIALGNVHGCALLQGGPVVCWGDSRYGQLGPLTPSGDGMASPHAVIAIGGGATALSAGSFHTCALRGGPTPILTCWGQGLVGQLGVPPPADGGSSSTPITVPLAASGGSTPMRVFAGVSSTCASDVAGRLYCWGLNTTGLLGPLGVGGNLTTPTVFQGLDNTAAVTHVAIGPRHACYTLDSGVATCLGNNNIGELGRGITSSNETNLKPVLTEAGAALGPTLMMDVSKIPFAFGSSCGLVRRCGGGTRAFCWGNAITQGVGDDQASSVARAVAAPTQ